MKFSVGPALTERQERQREATYEAAKLLRDAGFACDVTDLWAGEKNPSADSAMITLRVAR